MISDLGIDSLDLLDIGFAIDDAFGIELPLESWLRAVHMRTEAAEQYFVVQAVCAEIDALTIAVTP